MERRACDRVAVSATGAIVIAALRVAVSAAGAVMIAALRVAIPAAGAIVIATLAVVVLCPYAAQANASASGESAPIVTKSLRTSDDTELSYLLVRPATLEEGKAYPLLVALPPGDQKRPMAEWVLRTYWTAEAQRRGWIVVTPIRSGNDLLFERARGHFAELVEHLRHAFRIEGAKVHLAGVSNGGVSAFRAAISHPDLLHSLLTLPGFPPSESDFGRLPRLKAIPVTMYVGARDGDWVPQMERTRDALAKAGGTVTLTVMPAEGHVLRSLGDGRTLFDVLDRAR